MDELNTLTGNCSLDIIFAMTNKVTFNNKKN